MLDKASPDLWAALHKAQAEFKSVLKSEQASIKTSRGGDFSYSYANLDSVLEMARPVLAKHSLGIVQAPALAENGKLSIDTVLFHASGAYLQSSFILPVEQTGTMNAAQTVGAAITYARRYAIMSMLNIATEDNDANSDGPAAKSGGESSGEPTAKQLNEAILALASDPVFSEAEAGHIRKLLSQLRGDDVESLKNMKKVWEMRRDEKAKRASGEKDIL